MDELSALIHEYRGILEQETSLARRKEELRAAILAALEAQKLERFAAPDGTAARSSRFKLLPRRELVLETLDAEDLFAFAQFTPKRVSDVLVPKYGREKLIPLFEIQKTVFLLVRGPGRTQ